MVVIEIKMTITRIAEVYETLYPGYELQEIIDYEVKLAKENPEMFIDSSSDIEVTGKLIEDNE